MVNVFYSYSHRDEDLQKELEIHLTALRRQGLINTWHDRKIGAGKEFEGEIDRHLETADVILLLVSPYFIASEYCYDREMTRAMERHQRGEARVIPVILRRCEWQGLPFGKLLAVPADGNPISAFPDIHEGLHQVTVALKTAAKELRNEADEGQGIGGERKHTPTVPARQRHVDKPHPASAAIRIRKEFTDRDKDRFLDEAFECVANHFEQGLAALEAEHREIQTDFRRIDADHFSATIYRQGALANRCRIWNGRDRSHMKGIGFSVGDTPGDNSYNECLSVEDDGHVLFLKGIMGGIRGRGQEQMSPEDGAGYLWTEFLQLLQW